MKIACVQFAPQVSNVENNLRCVDNIIKRANLQHLDLLVLPELASSGNNYKSLEHITPCLEATASGLTSLWAFTNALKYKCAVTVGYAEKVEKTAKCYNSALIIDNSGQNTWNHRKMFLDRCDRTWASEGPDEFFDGAINGLGKIAMSISMNFDPHHLHERRPTWEFVEHILRERVKLVVIPVAWTTNQDLERYSRNSTLPDTYTLSKWIERLEPLIHAEEEITVVIANRCRTEEESIYAGTSCVLGVGAEEVKFYGILNRWERNLLFVDTSQPPLYVLSGDNIDQIRLNSTSGGNAVAAWAVKEGEIQEACQIRLQDWPEDALRFYCQPKDALTPCRTPTVSVLGEHQYARDSPDSVSSTDVNIPNEHLGGPSSWARFWELMHSREPIVRPPSTLPRNDSEPRQKLTEHSLLSLDLVNDSTTEPPLVTVEKIPPDHFSHSTAAALTKASRRAVPSLHSERNLVVRARSKSV